MRITRIAEETPEFDITGLTRSQLRTLYECVGHTSRNEIMKRLGVTDKAADKLLTELYDALRDAQKL